MAHIIMSVLYLSFFVCLTAYFILIAIRGIFKKKPFLMSTKWTFGFMLLCFLPALLKPLFISFHLALSQLVFYGLLFGFLARSLLMRQAYVIYGITDDIIREALHQVLKKMNLEFEETLSSIKVPSIPTELQVSVQTWMGVGQIRIKDKKDSKFFLDVVNGLSAYFQENQIKTNMVIFNFYLIFGIVFAIITLILPILFMSGSK